MKGKENKKDKKDKKGLKTPTAPVPQAITELSEGDLKQVTGGIAPGPAQDPLMYKDEAKKDM